MKTVRMVKVIICSVTLFLLFLAFSVQAQEQANVGGIALDIDVLSISMMEDVQTTTATLEGTAWAVDVFSLITFQTSPATLTFSNGMLTVSNWILDLNPGPYEETPYERIISFSATLEKSGIIQKQTFEVQGAAKPEKRIVGILQNLTTNVYYLFWGEPAAAFFSK